MFIFVILPILFLLSGYFLRMLVDRSKRFEYEKSGHMGHIPAFSYNVVITGGDTLKVLAASEAHVRQLLTTPKQVLYHGDNIKPMHGKNVSAEQIESITLDRPINSLVVRMRLMKKDKKWK